MEYQQLYPYHRVLMMEYHAATHIHVDVVLYDPQDKDSIVVHCIYTSEARLTVYTNDPLGHCGLAVPRR